MDFDSVPKLVAAHGLIADDLDDAADIAALVARGARVLRPLGAVPDEEWAILADPEGNEFCAFPPVPRS